MVQFFSPDIEESLALPPQESVHCCRVMRLHEGDVINVVNGKGKLFKCRILNADPKETALEIIEIIESSDKKNYSVSIAIAPTKNIDRIEWFVEKAVELGVDSLSLITCERSERKIIKPERVGKIVVSALKQSLRTRLPEISFFKNISAYLSSLDENCYNFVGYCDDNFPLKSFVKEIKPETNINVLIGPEGDFTEKEIKLCVEAGVVPVTFGNNRLRTETAALYALTAVNIINEYYAS